MPSSFSPPTSPLSPPTSPWSSLESTHGLCHVAADWRQRLCEHYNAFTAAFLQRRPGLATHYPCPHGCGCAHEIIGDPSDAPRSDAPFTAVCRCDPWTCDDLTLTADDVCLWELSWPRLARALCEALELDARPADLALPVTRQLGSWSSDAVPVILTVQTDSRVFRSVICELSQRLRHPFILLAPTSRHLDAPALELLSDAGAACFSLEASVRLNGPGALQALKPPGELFAKFTPQPKDSGGEDAARHAMELVRKFDTRSRSRPPTALTVFRLYCIDGLPGRTIARRLRCSRMTVLRRLRQLETVTGLSPDALRGLSSHLAHLERGFADSRARRIDRRRLIYDDAEQNEE